MMTDKISSQPKDIRASIDIGSNSIKLLIGRVEGKNVYPLFEKSEQTRLNKGLSKNGVLNPSAVKKTICVLRKFIQECLNKNTPPPIIFATSAVRQANLKSLQELLLPIWKEFELSIQVITPVEEAKLAFKGVYSNPSFQYTEPVLITDVGGGSAQFMIGKRRKCIWSRSCTLGAVHLLENFHLSDPPTPKEKGDLLVLIRKTVSDIRSEIQSDETIKKNIPDFSLSNLQWIGVGGAATILASMKIGLTRFNRNKLEAITLHTNDIQDWVDRIWTISLEERKQLPGLPSCRADITLTGTAIYLAIMQVFAFSTLRISTRGGRYGALIDRSLSSK